MGVFVLVTQRLPQMLVRLAWLLFRGGRWVIGVPVWFVFAYMLMTTPARVWDLTFAMMILVGLARLSLEFPWEDINRAVAYMFQPSEQRAILKQADRVWPVVCRETGLSRKGVDGCWVHPPLYALEFDDKGRLIMRPGLHVGDTIETLENALEPIRLAIGAQRGHVRTDATRNRFEYVFTFSDPLAKPINRELPSIETASPTDHATLGLTEDGEAWKVMLRVSTLTAGSTGSGKGSILWGLVIDQAPNIAAGLVQLHGVDLKGGMELALGRPLFTRFATDPAEAVVMLEEDAQDCQARAKRLAGVTRMHTATTQEPMVMIVVDELAALVAYSNDRDLMRRAENALAILLSQGRAVGYYVFGFLQDPRKEVLKIRNLFTQTIGLRLKEREEAAMILSAEAVRAGAECHHIPRDMPGIGYVLDETGQVTRVRASYCDDELIRATAANFPAPVQIPIVVPEPEPKTRRSRSERSEAA